MKKRSNCYLRPGLFLVLMALASGLADSSAKADDFAVGYNLDSNPGQASVSPASGYTDPSVTLSNTSLSGFAAEAHGSNTPQNDSSGYGVYPVANNVYGSTAAQAFGTYHEYLSFTLTAAAGQVVSLSQLQFGVSLPDEAATPALEYSTDGTTFTEMDPTSTTGAGVSNGHGGTQQGTFDFSTVSAFQHLTSGTTVTFDLLLLCPSGNGAFQDGVFDDTAHSAHGLDIEVDGTAKMIPEPSAWAMMVVGGVGLLLFAQRRHRTA